MVTYENTAFIVSTCIINHCKTISEAASWVAEIDAVRWVVCPGDGRDVVIVAGVYQRVAKDEQSRHELLT